VAASHPAQEVREIAVTQQLQGVWPKGIASQRQLVKRAAGPARGKVKRLPESLGADGQGGAGASRRQHLPVEMTIDRLRGIVPPTADANLAHGELSRSEGRAPAIGAIAQFTTGERGYKLLSPGVTN